MRKAPFRPGSEISQTYNSGVLTVYAVTDQAAPGYAPAPRLEKRADLRFEEQRLGLTRYYAALQANVQVERVVRVPCGETVSPQDVVKTSDGHFYEVNLVQSVPGVWPPSLDLTLARLAHQYPVPDSDAGEVGV